MRIQAVVMAVLLLGLSACQSVGGGYYDNPVAVGTELELLRALRVPPGLARIYLQGGETTDYAGLDQYRPFCYFLMRNPAPTAREIAPAVFRVRAVELREQDVRLPVPLRLAHRAGLGVGSDGPGVIAFETHMLLDGAPPQGPERLVCSGAFAPPLEAAPIRLDEMREVLGERVRVRVPGSTGS